MSEWIKENFWLIFWDNLSIDSSAEIFNKYNYHSYYIVILNGIIIYKKYILVQDVFGL